MNEFFEEVNSLEVKRKELVYVLRHLAADSNQSFQGAFQEPFRWPPSTRRT